MQAPDATRLMAALEATWPAAAVDEAAAPGWRLRDGAGGGKRASAAIPLGGNDFEAAAAAMRARGAAPLIRISEADAALDAALDAAGWAVLDPTVVMTGDPAALAALSLPEDVRPAYVRARMALVEEVWDAGGVGPERRAAMARAPEPRVTVIARTDTHLAGVGFLALDGEIAMLHAVEVRPEQRRQGAGRGVLAGAAEFARRAGAQVLALAVTEANAPARALYAAAGMVDAARYHYRQAPAEETAR